MHKSIEYQELERKRISNELHDTSLQDLTHIIHQIELANLYIDVDVIKAKLELEDVNNQLRKVIQDIRNTIFHLHPMSFDDLGLKEAIQQYIYSIQNKYSIFIESKLDNIDSVQEQHRLSVYRIIQEALLNSAKHSKASKIQLVIQDNSSDFHIVVKDDGIGMDCKKVNLEDKDKHYGLSIIKERVSEMCGECSIISDADVGTEIRIRIPKK